MAVPVDPPPPSVRSGTVTGVNINEGPPPFPWIRGGAE